MINMRFLFVAAVAVMLLAFHKGEAQEKMSRYVNPFFGTAGHGHTFPGATLPFGMVQLSPDTYDNDYDWCSGYHDSDSSIMGFSHTHLSGTGCPEYGDILFMPTTGPVKLNPGSREHPTEGYRSRFKHTNEKAEPGYYSVYLDDYSITAELTATLRTGFHRYTFPESNAANIIIDLTHGIGDKCLNAGTTIVNDSLIEGFRRSTGWNHDHTVYFAARFSKPFSASGVFSDGVLSESVRTAESKVLKAYVRYTMDKGETLLIKVGISHVGIEEARNNLDAENSGWDFERVKSDATTAWEKELSKISVEGGTEEQKTSFYTSLYHCLIAPNTFSDADGHYIGMDKKIYKSPAPVYTVFSLWDTFRALHPLLTVIDRKRTEEIVHTLYLKYKESGQLPIWELAGWETNCMIAYHSIPVIFDAYKKGIIKADIDSIFEAMKASADNNAFGVKSYIQHGYAQAEEVRESVSKTLEFAYDDWCIAMMAKDLGRLADYERYIKRSLAYINLFDGATGFMRGKNNGVFISPLNPDVQTSCYTESNAWQYAFFVPHDMHGLIDLFGSRKNFADKLDGLFQLKSKVPSKSTGPGIIGYYAHDNEPCHNFAYLYNYIGEGWKTQELVRKIMNDFYTAKRDGLPGNEDCGQMSAWYIFSALGLYPVCPGTNEYVIGSPIFKKAVLHLENGKDFIIQAPNSSVNNKYVQSLKVNGKASAAAFISQTDIQNGGEITFDMSDLPNKAWANDKESFPYSLSKGSRVSTPYIQPDENAFLDSLTCELHCRTEGAELHYTLDGSEPARNSPLYRTPVTIKNNSCLQAKGFKDGCENSIVSTMQFSKVIPAEAKVVNGLMPGLKYQYFEGSFSNTGELTKGIMKESGRVDVPSIHNAKLKENFGFIFEGYIKVPVDGIYNLYTESDDGTVLYIDGKLVIDNDGGHPAELRYSPVALKAGLHEYRLLYYQGIGDAVLHAGIQCPCSKAEIIPGEWFFSPDN